MTSINIKDFNHSNYTAIYEYLFTQNETEFEIIIPRELDAANCDNYTNAFDYLNAAYAGQRLAEISDKFAYNKPYVMNTSSFRFELTVSNMEKLTDSLHFILLGYYGICGDEPFLVFHQLAADFLNAAFENEIKCHT